MWRGSENRRAVALTFDDGPGESTPELLDVLHRLGIRCTFFMCGVHVRRLPSIAAAVAAAGHVIGNHTEHHSHLWLRQYRFLYQEIAAAQKSIFDVTGQLPHLFRAPYGVRWAGLGRVQNELGLLGVMWTVIGRDWKLDAPGVSHRIIRRVGNGSIICLHDGRELQHNPDIRVTIQAVRETVPRLIDAGYEFLTVPDLIG